MDFNAFTRKLHWTCSSITSDCKIIYLLLSLISLTICTFCLLWLSTNNFLWVLVWFLSSLNSFFSLIVESSKFDYYSQSLILGLNDLGMMIDTLSSVLYYYSFFPELELEMAEYIDCETENYREDIYDVSWISDKLRLGWG